jgi:hypothetical protein
MSEPSYALNAYLKVADELRDENLEPVLIGYYTLLTLTLGEATTLKDVHDAWALWRMAAQPSHRDLIPFADLATDVQERDRPNMDAIHRAARSLTAAAGVAS